MEFLLFGLLFIAVIVGAFKLLLILAVSLWKYVFWIIIGILFLIGLSA